MIASCGFLEDELRQYSKEEGVTMADIVETLRVDLRTRVKKRWGAKEQARKKKCKVTFLLGKKNKAFRKNYTQVGPRSCCEQYGASKNVGSACSVDGSHGKVKIEEADGSSSGENEYDTSLSLFMEASCENHCV